MFKLVVDFMGFLMILCDIDFILNRGEIVVIVGVFGLGKSMLLFIVVGLDIFSSGIVYIDGVDLFVFDED